MIIYFLNKLNIPKNLTLILILVTFVSCQKDNSLVKLNLSQAKKGELIQKVTLSGEVMPAKKALIMAPYNGHIKKIYVKLGQKVKVGDPLVSVSQTLASIDQVYPLRSPIAGTVVLIEKNEGEYVKEGDTKEFILRVDDLSELKIVGMAPEMDWAKIKENQEAIIKTQGLGVKKFRGKVRELSLAAKPKDNGNQGQMEFPIKIDVDNTDRQGLTPGMSVVVDVICARKKEALYLPHEFINQNDEGPFVTLKNGEKRKIKIGLQNENASEILSGITEKEEVQMVDFYSEDDHAS